MRTQRVVMLSSAFDEDGCLPKGVEDFLVEQLVPELVVEAFVVAILPWRSGLDLERLHADPAQPVTDGMGGELGTIVATDVIGRAVPLEQLGEDSKDVIAPELALDMDRQALAAVLVDHRQHAERPPVMRTISHKVVAPHVASVLRTQPYA